MSATLTEQPATESWRRVWRLGVAPAISTAGLEVLAKGLREDDPRLRQGLTTEPVPLAAAAHFDCEGACGVGYAAWLGERLTTTGQVEDAFSRAVYEANSRIDGRNPARHFLNFWDNTPRAELFPLILAEVERELARRAEGEVQG